MTGLILNPPKSDIKTYGILAHVTPGERKRVMETMTALGRAHYCDFLEARIEKLRGGK